MVHFFPKRCVYVWKFLLTSTGRTASLQLQDFPAAWKDCVFIDLFLWSSEEELATPPLDGIILPGITRQSILELTRQRVRRHRHTHTVGQTSAWILLYTWLAISCHVPFLLMFNIQYHSHYILILIAKALRLSQLDHILYILWVFLLFTSLRVSLKFLSATWPWASCALLWRSSGSKKCSALALPAWSAP